jgi:hypothetical protein
MPLCPPQIPHDLTPDRTRAAAVGSRRLLARATARPGNVRSVTDSSARNADRQWLVCMTLIQRRPPLISVYRPEAFRRTLDSLQAILLQVP